MLDFKFFDQLDDGDHIMDLRKRFVHGASDWMAGNNGSLQNDKDIFGYSDEQWQFIWSTMLADGAWAVPAIKDTDGNLIKDNFAPEIFIKYIAHDLKCNIIVFDLVLDKLQFISGNHLKLENVVFDSPLLLYATGSHFQAVFQKDHEYFVDLAREFEERNNAVIIPNGHSEINVTENCQSSEPMETNDLSNNDGSDNGTNKKIKIKDMNIEQKREYNREKYKDRMSKVNEKKLQDIRDKRAGNKESQRAAKRKIDSSKFKDDRAAEVAKTRLKKKEADPEKYKEAGAAEKAQTRSKKKELDPEKYHEVRAAEDVQTRSKKKKADPEKYNEARAAEIAKTRLKKKQLDPEKYRKDRAAEKTLASTRSH